MNQPFHDLLEIDVRITEIINVLSRTYPHGWKYNPIGRRSHAALYYIRSGVFSLQNNAVSITAEHGSVLLLDYDSPEIRANSGTGNLDADIICFHTENRILPGVTPLVVQDDDSRHYQNLFRQAVHVYAEHGVAYKLKVRSLIESILHSMLNDAAGSSILTTTNRKLLTAVQYIHTHMHEKITAEDLCRITHYSESHLRRLFIKEFGMSPMEYVNTQRMETAKKLLRNEYITIQEVALAVGFHSSSHFIRIFSQYASMTPGQYREAYAE